MELKLAVADSKLTGRSIEEDDAPNASSKPDMASSVGKGIDDTPQPVSAIGYRNRLDGFMPLQKLNKGGRPSKGDRHTFLVKPDIDRAAKLREIVELLNTNAVEYLTPIIAAHIDSVDIDELRIQEALPIAKAG